MTRKALVCGAGGFIGSHLIKKLKNEGYWVRGVDLKYPEFSKSEADDFELLDLREEDNCRQAVSSPGQTPFDEVYQLAADMGGMGFISTAECEIMRNSSLINIHMTHSSSKAGIKRYLFSSSACVYRDMLPDEPELSEEEAYPALPDNEYGWEKLYAERIAMAYGRRFDMKIRLARFQNTYGPEGTWRGGREKAPAALCRKIAEAKDGGTIEVWGDGTAMRAYTYIDDLVDGIFRLMHSGLEDGVNIGRQEYVSVNELVQAIAEAAHKEINIKHIEGPVGVMARNFRSDRIHTIDWDSKFSLKDGIALTYPWIKAQIESQRQTQSKE
ncbi:NAD-dependent epimerase/dehydratase family protein [Acidobacteriota bacterium]